jgi:mono/diheme cytochrome c family protein
MSSRRTGLGWLPVLVVLGVGCSPGAPAPKLEPLKLGDGRTVPAETLERGRDVYAYYCLSCHGARGDGQGPAAVGMRPPPRNFKQGLFKFGGVAAGELPTDEALKHTVRRGLHGTPMLPWGVPEADVEAVVQYVKTFSSRWQQEAPGKPLEVSADPWKGREAEALEKGKFVFHVAGKGNAGCSGCHISYLPKPELEALVEQVTGRKVDLSKVDPYTQQARDSDYSVAVDEKGEPAQMARVLPPDFLLHRLRTVWPLGTQVEGAEYTPERQREDLYRVIAAGVGGAAMPTWKGAIPEENLWALAYYVQTLVNQRDTAEGRVLKEHLRNPAK